MTSCARFICAVAILGAFVDPALAQPPVPGGARSADDVWQIASDQNLPAAQRRLDIDGAYAVLQLNRTALEALLAQAPDENAPNRAALPVIVATLPLPDGRFSRFRIEESPILVPELAAAFPEIKTYRGAGLDDPTATARIDITQAGFHAMVIAAGGTVYIDPYSPGDLVNHVSYDKASLRRTGGPFADLVEGSSELERVYNELPITNGTILRTYRLALAATTEYTTAAGGKVGALSRMTTTMNRVNGIYEREVAVRMTVATGTPGDPTALIYAAEPDPYTNGNGSLMLTENQNNLTAVVGTANFDIGHVFSNAGGGVAVLNSPCNASTKARGVTGLSSPFGDAFDVDYVSHEMGHQFGANHTFNSVSGSCNGNRSTSHAYEIGSGSTIMSYSGICSPENLQQNSNDLFNFESLNEITAFITTGGGSVCPSAAATGNTLPVIGGPGASFSIPVQTPFALTASGSDANGDALTYIWEEHDLGNSSANGSAGVDDGSRPLFRSFTPTTSPSRTFPALTHILNSGNVPPPTFNCSGLTCITGEVLPASTRTLTFEATVRDNRAGGGGIATTQTTVFVNGTAGPFTVTSPNTGVTWSGLSTQTVTWSVNGTNALATNVRISVSTDGGVTFPTTLLASTPNDGAEPIAVPNTPTGTARIKIEAVGNIFFDISNTSFTITPGGPPPGAFTKSSPALGATGQSVSPTLSWGASSGATSYEYCVDTSANATCDAGWVSSGAATSALLSGLSAGTTYSWQARAVNVAGMTQADSGTWWTFTTQALANPLADLAIDFGAPYGLWSLYDAGGSSPLWQWLHSQSPTVLTRGDLDGNGRTDLIVGFAGYGVWTFMNNMTWTQLHPTDASDFEAGDLDGNGRDELIVDFPGSGVWVRYDNGTWVHLHPQNVAHIAVGNIDGSAGGRADVILSFAGPGIWAYRNNSTWSQLHPMPARDLQLGDLDGNGVSDLIVQFAGLGEWVLYNSTTWTQLDPLAAAGIVTGNIDRDAGGRSDVVVHFPGSGVWAFINGTSWVQLHPFAVTAMATGDIDGNGAADVILSFTGYGVWVLKNLTTWTQLHGFQAEALASGLITANRD